MKINRQGIKKLHEMFVDAQYAQQLGLKYFNNQVTTEEIVELKEIADELVVTINEWKSLIV